MLDLAGILTSPRLFLGALVGLQVGLAVAFVVRYPVGPKVPIKALAPIAAGGIILGLFIAARTSPEIRDD